MIIEQLKYTTVNGWEIIRGQEISLTRYDLVFVFGSNKLLSEKKICDEIRNKYKSAVILMSSTAGEIINTSVCEDSIALTAIKLEKSSIKAASININSYTNSFDAAQALAKNFALEGLKNVFIISDGRHVNGSDLVSGLQSILPKDIIFTGGLAGDGIDFNSTLVSLDSSPQEGNIAAIGFYGDLKINHGCAGGWDTFGPERLITKSNKNVLYELDDQPALDIYKKYLGDKCESLPSSALLFPLSIRDKDNYATVRTILSIDEKNKSLTFAGNMPEGNYARLMKANIDRLIDGSHAAASHTHPELSPDLAILISCIGRKLVLDQRVEEEVEIVRSCYGNETALTGFYSYGEIAPANNSSKCDLHNQTMTITSFKE